MYNPYQGESFLPIAKIWEADWNFFRKANHHPAPGAYGGAPEYGAYGAPPGMGGKSHHSEEPFNTN